MKGIMFFLLIFISFNALSKCPKSYITLEGYIKNYQNEPIVGAKIYVFINGSETSNVENNGYDYCESDSNGKFECLAYYDTYSFFSIFKGDVCKKKPSKIELLIIHKCYYANKETIKNRKMKEKKVFLPPIFMIEKECETK
jgi:hypothetical protein